MKNSIAQNRFCFTRLAAPLLILACVFFTFATSGCATLMLAPRFNAADHRFELDRPYGSPVLSANASQILRENAIPTPSNVDELSKLRALVDMSATPDLVYAYAETAYLQARKLEKSHPLQAQRLYADVMLFSWHFLFNPALSNAHDRATWNGQLADVVLLYNGASERFLHLAIEESSTRQGVEFPFQHDKLAEIKTESGTILVRSHVEPGGWNPDEYGDFRVAADCAVDALSFDCRQSGFGVPLVVERRAGSQTNRVEEKYYPPAILFPATAVLRPNPATPLGSLPPIDPNATTYPGDADFTLDVFDPFTTSDLVESGRSFPLETDLTTPLAYSLATNDRVASRVARKSLLKPEELQQTVKVGKTQEERQLQGLYLLEPYDPNKIPVVMSHGLASSPVTWVEMYNALRSSKGLRSGYQFMFFFYPTGQPFWASAATLRHELREFREVVDPEHTPGPLDDVVLIGHSMGGLVSRMQVQASGSLIWNVVSSKPIDSFNFDEEARQKLEDWFFFEPNPSVKRVITIATPFHGSEFANTFTNWLAEHAITVPQTVATVLTSTANLTAGFGRKKAIDDFDSTLLSISTSVESLDPNCPIFKVLDELPIPSDVALDNIVGVLPQLENRRFNPKKSDGVVDFESAHRDDVELEVETPAAHTTVHTHFDAINQVRSLLVRHLALYSPPVDSRGQTTSAAGAPAAYVQGPVGPERPAGFDERPRLTTTSPQTVANAYGPSYDASAHATAFGPSLPPELNAAPLTQNTFGDPTELESSGVVGPQTPFQ